MIFMSQSGMTKPERQAEWDQWYMTHLQVMLTVNGIDSAQRFTLMQGENSPSLAMYTIASPDVFQDAYYLRIRGMGRVVAADRPSPLGWCPCSTAYLPLNYLTGFPAPPIVPASCSYETGAYPTKEYTMAESDNRTYKLIELVGVSSESYADATKNAVARASSTLRGLGWFQVTELRGLIQDGQISEYQVTMKVGFRLLDSDDL